MPLNTQLLAIIVNDSLCPRHVLYYIAKSSIHLAVGLTVAVRRVGLFARSCRSRRRRRKQTLQQATGIVDGFQKLAVIHGVAYAHDAGQLVAQSQSRIVALFQRVGVHIGRNRRSSVGQNQQRGQSHFDGRIVLVERSQARANRIDSVQFDQFLWRA